MKRKVLIVEDNQLDQKILENLIKKQGFHVDLVSDGMCAVEKLISENYQLIILDLTLPNINGVQFLMGFNGSFCMRNTAVFVITGRDGEDVDRLCKSLGAKSVFKKPILNTDTKKGLLAALSSIDSADQRRAS